MQRNQKRWRIRAPAARYKLCLSQHQRINQRHSRGICTYGSRYFKNTLLKVIIQNRGREIAFWLPVSGARNHLAFGYYAAFSRQRTSLVTNFQDSIRVLTFPLVRYHYICLWVTIAFVLRKVFQQIVFSRY